VGTAPAVSAGSWVGLGWVGSARQAASCKGGGSSFLYLFILPRRRPRSKAAARRRLRGVEVPCGHAPPRVWLGGLESEREGAVPLPPPPPPLPCTLALAGGSDPDRRKLELSALYTGPGRLTDPLRAETHVSLSAPTCVLCSPHLFPSKMHTRT
jgi:hypothetical protein